MSLRVVINQSNYIPWKGYFDLVHDADVFVFYDDVQFTKSDWRNRNRIKTARGVEWLTIPVGQRQDRLINQVLLPADTTWKERHWNALCASYASAPYFRRYAELLECTIRHCPFSTLSELNQTLIARLCSELGIQTRFERSEKFGLTMAKEDRVIELLKKLGATTYVSGPAGKSYLDPSRFEAEGIELIWKDYHSYPEYPQSHPPFEHAVSIVDVLFHCGPASPKYVWDWRDRRPIDTEQT